MSSLTRRARRALTGTFALAITMLALAAPAHAIMAPMPIMMPTPTIEDEIYMWLGTDATPAADYRGWAYISSPQPVLAWKWTSNGWQSTTLNVGASVWAHPWTDIWTWAYRDDSWFAVRQNRIREWSCSASPAATVTIRNRTAAFRYNSSSSTVQGYLAAGTQVKLGCGNAFTDAQADPPGTARCMAMIPECWRTQYVMVYANPLPACLVPVDPNGIRCMIAVMNNPRWVYVPTTAFKDRNIYLYREPIIEPGPLPLN